MTIEHNPDSNRPDSDSVKASYVTLGVVCRLIQADKPDILEMGRLTKDGIEITTVTPDGVSTVHHVTQC